ncbi:hypothetical protein SK128_011885 [Halocaridina rubra]|uniref:Uncharacterized protein n=1 Tax=Halocaridina rubra TaxID=373956 RepID=A0AAN8WA42_HALRR
MCQQLSTSKGISLPMFFLVSDARDMELDPYNFPVRDPNRLEAVEIDLHLSTDELNFSSLGNLDHTEDEL